MFFGARVGDIPAPGPPVRSEHRAISRAGQSHAHGVGPVHQLQQHYSSALPPARSAARSWPVADRCQWRIGVGCARQIIISDNGYLAPGSYTGMGKSLQRTHFEPVSQGAESRAPESTGLRRGSAAAARTHQPGSRFPLQLPPPRPSAPPGAPPRATLLRPSRRPGTMCKHIAGRALISPIRRCPKLISRSRRRPERTRPPRRCRHSQMGGFHRSAHARPTAAPLLSSKQAIRSSCRRVRASSTPSTRPLSVRCRYARVSSAHGRAPSGHQ